MFEPRSADMQPEGTVTDRVDLPVANGFSSTEPAVANEAICAEPAPAELLVPDPPRPKAQPVQPLERVAAVDVLRGVALMGILAMNIVGFAWPMSTYDSPRAGGNTSTTDLVVWSIHHVVFDEKMMTIFSMLFGAGLILMAERSDARGASLAGVYYRRVTWLLVIGLLHAYFIWDGDILVLYAECGFLLYLFRKRSPRFLIGLGTLCLLVLVFLGVAATDLLEIAENNYPGVEGTPRRVLAWAAQAMDNGLYGSRTRGLYRFTEVVRIHSGGYWGIVRHRALPLLGEQTALFLLATLWMVGGRMLIGMGLMKLDVFSARRSRRFYLRMIALGYGIGLPLVGYDIWLRIAADFQGATMIQAKLFYGYVSAVPIALGHVGVVMLIFQSGAIPWLTRRLAAAGRMALSNYLMQSLICTTLFYGYGCALYGMFHRLTLDLFVVSIWAFQLTTSIIWLRYFRYGPAEWLWRSLTYWKLQPMRIREPAAAIAVPSEGVVTELPAAPTDFTAAD
jgi:uncharacterized protein